MEKPWNKILVKLKFVQAIIRITSDEVMPAGTRNAFDFIAYLRISFIL